eukprot:2636381-Karenia_brevis.AAC.1
MQALWRPALHVTGCIALGYLEVFWIMHADQHKDSNMEATVISKTLDLVCNKVTAGNPAAVLPRSL